MDEKEIEERLRAKDLIFRNMLSDNVFDRDLFIYVFKKVFNGEIKESFMIIYMKVKF